MVAIVTRAGKGAPLTNAEVDANFVNLNAGVVGNVAGPAGATDNAIARFDGATGKLVQNSNVSVDDAGSVYASGNASFGTGVVQAQGPGYGPGFEGVRFNGTAGAPTAVKAFDELAAFTGKGRAATGWAGPGAAISMASAGDWTDASTPAVINFGTTPVGSAAFAWRWQISEQGHLNLHANNAYDIGSAATRVRTVFAQTVNTSADVVAGGSVYAVGGMKMGGGPVNSIFYFDNGAANAALLYDKAKNEFQFFGPAPQVFIGAATGNLSMNGNLIVGGNLSSGAASFAGPISTTGANGIIGIAPRDGTGNTFGFYNPTGDNLRLWTGAIDAFTIQSDGSTEAAGNSVTRGLITVGPAQEMTLRANAADNNTLLSFRNSTGVYFIYDWPSGYLSWVAGGASRFSIGSSGDANIGRDLYVTGDLVFRVLGYDDRPEPRGRYWKRPAPNGNYTFMGSDAGTLVVQVYGAPCVMTIAPQSTGAFLTQARIDIVQWGAGQITIAPGAGVGLHSAGNKFKTAGQYSGVSLVMINPDDWWLVGDLVA